MKVAYYPGCSNHGTSREFEKSARAVFQDLSIELEEVPDWVCCAASPGHHHSKLLSISLGAYNLLQARPMNLPVLATCAACYARLSATNYELKHDPELAAQVAETVEETYDGSVPVKHIVDFLIDDVGLPEIEKKIKLWKLHLEFPGVGEVIYCPDPVAASELSSNRGLRGLVSNIVEKGKSIIFSRETLEAEMIPRDSLW